MTDIKTLTQEFSISGSLLSISRSLADPQIRADNEELKASYILKQKIDELVTEVNILKNQ